MNNLKSSLISSALFFTLIILVDLILKRNMTSIELLLSNLFATIVFFVFIYFVIPKLKNTKK